VAQPLRIRKEILEGRFRRPDVERRALDHLVEVARAAREAAEQLHRDPDRMHGIA
jgi:hypothetical protein